MSKQDYSVFVGDGDIFNVSLDLKPNDRVCSCHQGGVLTIEVEGLYDDNRVATSIEIFGSTEWHHFQSAVRKLGIQIARNEGRERCENART